MVHGVIGVNKSDIVNLYESDVILITICYV